MRNFWIILLLTLIGTASACAPSSRTTADVPHDARASSPQDTGKAAIGVRTARHMKVALLTARQMLSGDGEYRADEVTIVACGKGVPALKSDGDLADDIASTQSLGAKIRACGLTVEQMGLSPDALAEGVEVVPNGFVELIRLQSKGYYTIEL